MGAYYYITSPKMTAQARVQWADGREETITLALYRYAYKPYSDWGDGRKWNNRMHFKSGAAACEAAYQRSAQGVPAWGIAYDEEKRELYALRGPNRADKPFRTKGHAGGLDDYDFCNYEGAPVILEYIELPKGFSVKPLPYQVDNSREIFGDKTSIADLAANSFTGFFQTLTNTQARDVLARDWKWELASVEDASAHTLAAIFKDGSRLNVEVRG